MRVKTKSKKKIINNSYETEPSSCSITSSEGGTDSNDESLSIHRHQRKISKNIMNSYKIANATHNGGEVNLMKKKLKRIEDSSFFRNKIELNHKLEVETDHEDNNSCDENNIEGIMKDDLKKKKEFLIRDESSQSLKFKICSKLVEGETIYEMVSIENSCNAIDTSLSQNNSTEIPSELSFNGKINNLKGQFKALIKNDNNISGPLIKTSNNSIEKQEINHLKKKQGEVSDDDSTNFQQKNYQQSLNNLNLKEITEKNIESMTRREMSPDLFDDYDNTDAEECDTEKDCYPTISFSEDKGIKYENKTNTIQTKNENKLNTVNDINQNEMDLLKKIQNSLKGVPPPPSKTIPQIDLLKIIPRSKNKILNFFESFTKGDKKLDTACDLNYVKESKWSDSLKHRYYGISYNTSEASEKIDSLSLSVVDRYVGAETKSSHQLSPSSAKKRSLKLKQLNQSPGSRLSHLAKRRAIFSSANLLQSNTFKLCSSKRQILLDKGKAKNKRKTTTPRRKTPGSKKKAFTRKTPTSSAKKNKIFWNEKPNPSRETSKRALFQSPPQIMAQKSQTHRATINPEIANRVERSKRALFSPDEKFNLKMFSQPNLSQGDIKSESYYFSENSQPYFENPPKRMCIDGNISLTQDRKRIIRLDSSNSFDEQLTPRSLKFRSQSFCTEANPSNNNNGNKFLIRARSDSTFYSGQLTESHKKKLLWAVSLALQKKQISLSHPDFKKHASVLAKAIKRLFLEFYKKTNSTSETMLRLSKKYVFHVIQGKTIDDIYSTEKKLIENEKIFSTKIRGYICSEDYAKLQNNSMISKNHNKAENKLPKTASFSLSENSIDLLNNNSQINQDSPVVHFNNITYIQQDQQTSAIKLPIQITKNLLNSSSKNNLGDSALRENVNELRKSGQKNFTGKDQRNVSPYKSPHLSSSSEKSVLNRLKSGNNIFDLNTGKAKRQISFDY